MADLLASLAASVSEAFSDKSTIVGSLSAAQAGFAANDAKPGGAAKAPTPFAITLAKVSFPNPLTLAGTTAAKAAATYADNGASRGAA